MSTNLRLPPDLHAQIKTMANQETRSLHGQVIQLLREALAARVRPDLATAVEIAAMDSAESPVSGVTAALGRIELAR